MSMPQAAPAPKPGSTSSSQSSNIPVLQDCNIPGKCRWLLWRTTFEIDEKYQPIKGIGKGAFGVVCSAKNKATGEKVAIKKIGNAFENLIDARRTLRELRILRHLKHDNIIAMKDLLRPPSKDFNDVYIVYELMDTDLHQIIRSSQPLTNEHFQYFVYQMLRGLKYVHTANVLHRDLKPSNLLLNASCDLKICDFGLARTVAERSNHMTEYVVTRWYRAPELLLSCEHYTAAIDMWSVGCIIAEMLGRKPLMPAPDYIEQLKMIVRTLGPPSEEDMSFISSQKARAYIRALPRTERVDFRKKFPDADPLAIDLMGKMLQFDPRKRIDVHQALKHPWLAQLHDEAAEPCAPGEFVLDFEDEQLTEQNIRRLIYEELMAFPRR